MVENDWDTWTERHLKRMSFVARLLYQLMSKRWKEIKEGARNSTKAGLGFKTNLSRRR